MKALVYTFQLNEPVLSGIPESGEPNSASSQCFIPGSMIRGALVRAVGGKVDLKMGSEWRKRFLSGDVRFLHAYPREKQTKMRMLPAALSWFMEKDNLDRFPADVFDYAVEEADLELPKNPKQEFGLPQGEALLLYSPARQITVHNQSLDRDQKTGGPSQVFRYESLAEDELFTGVILAEDDQILQQFEQILKDGTLSLGGSASAGYGHVEVLDAHIDQNWTEYSAGENSDGMLTVTLLSDLIIAAPEADLDATIASLFGISLPDPDHRDGYISFMDLRPVSGFNRKWGLPLQREWAVQAGSVFRYPVLWIYKDKLIKAEQKGAGQRTVEGYGRIAINWQQHKSYSASKAGREEASPKPDHSENIKELAGHMAERMLRSRLERGLGTALDPLSLETDLTDSLPSKAQMARVRTAARKAMAAKNMNPVSLHIQSLKTARKDWEKAYYKRVPLLDWIQARCSLDEADFRQVFGVLTELPTIAKVPANLSSDLKVEYTARLVDGLMKLAIEQVNAQAEEGGQG